LRAILLRCNFLLSSGADYAKGFGGKYGVQKDRQDKAALGWEVHEPLAKHESQKGVDSDVILHALLLSSIEQPPIYVIHLTESFH